MDFLPENRILEFRPDTLELFRKQFNIEKQQLKEAINILKEWVQKQSHFKRKQFRDRYYEACIMLSKGYIERAKKQIDNMCTFRTLMPQFFGNYNIKTDFGDTSKAVTTVLLPKLTEEGHRVIVIKFYNADYMNFLIYYRYNIQFAEYVKMNDYVYKYILLLDYSSVNVADLVAKCNPVELRNIVSIFKEGYALKVGGLHVVASSKLVDVIVKILKQILSPKVTDKIFVHKTEQDIQKHISKSILPKDYGGEERSLKELTDLWVDELSKEDSVKLLREFNEATTDESCRQEGQFFEQFAGMPGTFRALKLD